MPDDSNNPFDQGDAGKFTWGSDDVVFDEPTTPKPRAAKDGVADEKPERSSKPDDGSKYAWTDGDVEITEG